MSKEIKNAESHKGKPDKTQRKIGRRGFLITVLSLLLAMGLCILGMAARDAMHYSERRGVFIAVFAALCLIPIAVGIWSMLAYKKANNRIGSMRITEVRDLIIKERNGASERMEETKSEMRRLRRKGTMLAAFLFLIAAGTAFLCGVLTEGKFLGVLICLYPAALFASVLIRIPMEMPLDIITDDRNFIKNADYPKLCSLAEEAAAAMGLKCPLRIAILPNGNVGVIKMHDAVLLGVGLYSLVQMNEDELKSIFCHEFSHVINEEKNDPEKPYLTRYSSFIDSILAAPSGMLFAKIDSDYSFKHEMYRFASSLLFEQEADRAMTELTDKGTAASALIKVAYTDYYLYEEAFSRGCDRYAGDEPAYDEATKEIESFIKTVAERKEFWNTLIPKEILSRTATHPTLAMRLEALGVSNIETSDVPAGADLAAEQAKAIKHCDVSIRDERLENYGEARRIQHEKPLETLEKWKKEGEPLTPEGYRVIVEAMTDLGMTDEAEDLCDRAMNALPEEARGFACFTKGRMLLHRYDEAGIELLYCAMEHNQNYIDLALDEIGSYCCRVGNDEELARYREKSMELMQKHADEYDMIADLKRGDDLRAEQLPEGALGRDVSYILKAGEGLIEKLYLVRKTIPNGFFTSAYVVKFEEGTEWEKQNEILERIFNYLDTVSDWQYSLFTWDEAASAGIDKIEGALVFEKEE
ncbi:MAG: M48 family metalloprotease [Clostridia bacterium]|nr:M48 family metalloprotease [Clostridia bacterium]